MNSLSRQTTEHLIQSLEAGEIDHTEAAKRIAQLHTANTEKYRTYALTERQEYGGAKMMG